jgi:CHAT domain-containing protein
MNPPFAKVNPEEAAVTSLLQHIRRLVWVMQKGRPTRVVSLALLAALLVGQSPSAWSRSPAQAEVIRVAQSVPLIEPLTITGVLDENSELLEDGRSLNVHPFEGVAGQIVVIDLISDEFDVDLGLVDPNGELIAADHNSGEGSNARLALSLADTGTYLVGAVSSTPGEIGRYQLTLYPGTAADVERAEQLAKAARFNTQGVELYQAGRLGEAEPLFQESLTIRREQLGDRHPDIATSLNNLAELYRLQGRYGEAEPLLQESLAIWREQLGDRHPHVATSLNNLAALYQVQGRFGEAEILFQESLNILREQLGDNHPDVANSLNNLAELYREQGRFREAEPLLQESLAIWRKQLGDSHLDVATSLNNLAELYRLQGRYGEAEPLHQESLAISREQLGDSHLNVANSLNNLALLYQDQGRYGEAETLFQESLTIFREQLGDRHPDVSTSLNNLAALYETQGHYGEAETLLQESLTIRREQLGDRHPDIATSLNNLALLYRAQGRYGEAETLLQESLNILREQLGDRHPDVATSLNNLAALYETQGRFGEAEPLYRESLTIRREQLGDRHPDIATSLNNLAVLYVAQGRFGEAEPLYRESLAIRRDQLSDDHADVATSLNNLAGLYQTQGRYEEAEPLYQESLTIFREQLGDRHPDVANSLNNLAALYQTQGRYGEAVAFLSQGLDIEEWNLDLNLATLPEAQRQAYVATISGTGQLPISFHLQSAPDSPEAANLALTTLLRRKGRLLDAGTDSLQRLRQNLTPDDQLTLDQLTDTQRQLSTLTFNPPPDLPPEQYRARLAELEAQANQLEATLARRSAAFRVETQSVELAAVQAKIPVNGVLVEFTQYRPFYATDGQNRWGAPRYAAYMLFPDGRIEAVDLGEAAPIDQAIQAFVALLQDPRANFRTRAGITVEIRADVVEGVSDTLKALVLDPIAPHLQPGQHLLISPDGQLNRLPFEALFTDSGQYLVEQHPISYLSSGRDLLRFGVLPPSTAPAVVLANPDYDLATAGTSQVSSAQTTGDRATDLSQLTVDPLPGTAAEVEAIAPLLTAPTLLTEAQATEAALKQVQSPKILHIATHGFFLADAPPPEPTDIGTLALGDGTRAFGTLSAPVENPLLRSGLALAGFNTWRGGGTDDGVLTALEASQLNLTGTQLVILSACDTGLGDINNGEGVYGLRRAFAIAGAETQLLSLWQVSDDGTQSLMARYYENLIDGGMGRSDALRQVQLEMIRSESEYSHPYYWAAFVLAGDWRALQ